MNTFMLVVYLVGIVPAIFWTKAALEIASASTEFTDEQDTEGREGDIYYRPPSWPVSTLAGVLWPVLAALFLFGKLLATLNTYGGK